MEFYTTSKGKQLLNGTSHIDCGYQATFNCNGLNSRIDAICNISTNKNILHIGCLDHLPLITQKISSNQWLHGLLTEKASKCIGIDINKQGICYVREKLGYKNVVYADITKSIPNDILKENWDYIILGEMLEHTNNPQLFLSSIRKSFQNCANNFIISVPYAFHKENFHRAAQNTEQINSDHRFWFTPYTIAKICAQSHLEINKMYFVDFSPLSLTERFFNLFHVTKINAQQSSTNYRSLLVTGEFRVPNA